MKHVFADTHYWIAITRPKDQSRKPALGARKALGNVILVTTDEVLAEFMTALSTGGRELRRRAVKMVKEILRNPNVKVLPQTRDSFLKGVELYAAREDKKYSLPDCISMNAMEAHSIREVLTHDHHFGQEGYVVLIR
jgi:predicted nucleic acid-binding protein